MREYAVSATQPEEILDFDVIVFGAGAAGLYTALNLDGGLFRCLAQQTWD